MASITIYLGLYYITVELDEWVKLIFFIVIIAVNVYFLVYWVKKVLETGIGLLGNKIPCIRNLLIRKV